MKRIHHHPCQTCRKKTECGGDWEQNYDGWPEVICREFHRHDLTLNPDFICHDCNELELRETGATLAGM